MAIEYYYVQECNCCGNEIKKLIGYRKIGFAFQLKTYKDYSINSLSDWIDYLTKKIESSYFVTYICDNHGNRYYLDELKQVILDSQKKYCNCLRHNGTDNCIKKFDTYDLIK